MAKQDPRVPNFGHRVGDDEPVDLTSAESIAAWYEDMDCRFCMAMQAAHPERNTGISSEPATVTVHRSHPTVDRGASSSLGWV